MSDKISGKMNEKINEEMKILHVIERFYPLIGGAEVQALQLIKKQLVKGINANVLTRKVDSKLKDSEEFEKIKIFRIEPKGLEASKLKFAWNVYKFIKDSDYDLIHVHGVYSLFGMAAVLSNKKVIGKITNSRGSLKQNKLIKFFKLFIFKKIDKLIAISNQIQSEVHQMGFKDPQIAVIPNGVDIDKFKNGPLGILKKKLKRKLNLPQDKKIAIFSGRLVQQKGLDILLKAMIEVIKKEPNILLLVFGTGKLQEKNLEEENKLFIDQNKLNQNIKLMGNVYNLEDYLKAADFFFFPTRREGLPNALLEAAASGLPIVASRIGGNVDIIENGYNGLLFESENVEELSEKIITLIENKEMQEKFSKNARNTVVNKFSLDIVTEKYVNLYQNLTGKKK